MNAQTRKLRRRRENLSLLLINGVILVLSLLLNACGAQPTPAPSDAPTAIPTTAIPTATSTLMPTILPTPTALAPLDGRGGGVIAFTSMERTDWQIYIINADGSGKTMVTVGVKGGYEPNWSPDGTKIVFQYGGIWIADIISGEIARLPLKGASDNLPNEYLVKPAWSPNGEWIAFLNENGTQGDIYLVRPDGTDLMRLTTSNDISRDGNLVWSPDAEQIAYSADRDGNTEIYVMNVEAALQGDVAGRQLTDTSPSIRNLVTSWSPDGSRIAFSSDRDRNTEIYFMSPDGGKVVRLTNNPAFDAEPRWSPDGKLIAFSSDRGGNVEIYVLDVDETIRTADDTTARRLTDHPGDDTGPVWRPSP